MVIAVKICAEAVIKVPCSCPILLELFINFVLFIVVGVTTKQFRRWFKKSCYFCRNISFNSIYTFDKKLVCELQLLTKFDKPFPLPHFQFFFRIFFVSTGKTWPSTDSIIFSCTVYKRKETHNKNTVI